jgi:hypothetical protein
MTEHLNREFGEYYLNQAKYALSGAQTGGALDGFGGYQYQRGHGFFSSIFRNILKPLGLYLGKQALTTGVNVGKDILEGENLKESLKKNAKLTGKNMFNDTIDRVQKFAQTGSGKRRRRRRRSKKVTKTSKKAINKTARKRSKTVLKKKSKKRRRKKTLPKSKFSHIF